MKHNAVRMLPEGLLTAGSTCTDRSGIATSAGQSRPATHWSNGRMVGKGDAGYAISKRLNTLAEFSPSIHPSCHSGYDVDCRRFSIPTYCPSDHLPSSSPTANTPRSLTPYGVARLLAASTFLFQLDYDMSRLPRAAWLALAVVAAFLGISIKTGALKFIVIGPLVTTFLFVLSGLGAVAAAAYLEQRVESPSLTERQALATRPFVFATDEAWPQYEQKRREDNDAEPKYPPVHGFEEPKVAARLDAVLRLIRGSFILPWFSEISRAPAFPNKVEGVVRHALGEVAHRIEVIDWPNLGVARILPIVTEHIAHYRSIEHLAGSIGTSDALPLPLPKDAHPAFTQHTHTSAESNIPSIEAHLRKHVERIVAAVLPEQERTAVVHTIVREIVLGAILMPMFNLLSEPDFWNRQINEQGGKYLHQR